MMFWMIRMRGRIFCGVNLLLNFYRFDIVVWCLLMLIWEVIRLMVMMINVVKVIILSNVV